MTSEISEKWATLSDQEKGAIRQEIIRGDSWLEGYFFNFSSHRRGGEEERRSIDISFLQGDFDKLPGLVGKKVVEYFATHQAPAP
jgi:hypothetical protein